MTKPPRDRDPLELIRSALAGLRFGERVIAVHDGVAITPGDKPTSRGLKPIRPLDPSTGTWGAVEVAARYAELRLDPKAFDAGIAARTSSIERARAVTVGANWYFNEYLKLQLDYEATVFRGGAMTGNRTTEHVIATRLQAAI